MKTIEITDEQYDFLMNLSKELKTQDNRITADPIFCVYQKKFVYVPEGCGNHIDWFFDGHIQTKEDIKEIIEEYKTENINSILNDEEILEELNYRKCDYNIEDVVVNGQYYFSEKAAQDHIDRNSYHYSKPFTYVESAWRNNEWNLIREIILNLTKGNIYEEKK